MMKKLLFTVIILSFVLSLFTSCAHKHNPLPEDSEGRIYCSDCGELLNGEELSGTELTQATTQVETSTVKPTENDTSTVLPTEITTEEATSTTTPAATSEQTTSAPTTKPSDGVEKDNTTTTAPHQPATEAPSADVKVDSSNVITNETTPHGHYKNNIDAYYSGNVLVCGDYGLEYFSLSANGNSEYAAAVNGFAAKYPSLDISCLLVPKSATFCAPSGYSYMYENHLAFVNATYAKLDNQIKTPDAMTLFNTHKGEYLFYRTDHHWTSLGAYYASVAYCNENGITPRELKSYDTIVNTGYIGSLYSFCASPKPACLTTNPDYTVGHLPNVQYSMSYINMNGQQKTGAVIDTSAKSYAGMFMCGDEPFADITTSAGTDKKLLVFKESYGNAFVPYMIDYFDEIIVIDIRHYTGSTKETIEKYGITHALIINNLQSAESLISQLKTRLAS